MSGYAFCKRGGVQGILVTDEELNSFSDAIDSNILDGVIPLPNLTIEQQKIELILCNNHEDVEYWERTTGHHGWCCSHCGKVIQWG